MDEHADRHQRQSDHRAREAKRGLEHRTGAEEQHLRQGRRAEDEPDQQGAGEPVLLTEHLAQDDRGDAAEQTDDREARECAERARDDGPRPSTGRRNRGTNAAAVSGCGVTVSGRRHTNTALTTTTTISTM